MVDKATLNKLTKSPVFLGAAALAAGAGVYALAKSRGAPVATESQEPAVSPGMSAKEAGFGGVLDTSGPEYYPDPGAASQYMDSVVGSVTSAAEGLAAQTAAQPEQPFDARVQEIEKKLAAEVQEQDALVSTIDTVKRSNKKQGKLISALKKNLKKNTQADKKAAAGEKKHEKKQAKNIKRLKNRLDAQAKAVKAGAGTGTAKAISAQIKPKVKAIDAAKLKAGTTQQITAPAQQAVVAAVKAAPRGEKADAAAAQAKAMGLNKKQQQAVAAAVKAAPAGRKAEAAKKALAKAKKK